MPIDGQFSEDELFDDYDYDYDYDDDDEIVVEAYVLRPETRGEVIDWINSARGRGFNWDQILYMELSDAMFAGEVETDESALAERWRFMRYLNEQKLLDEFPQWVPDMDEEVLDELHENNITSRELMACVLLIGIMPVVTALSLHAGTSITELVEDGVLEKLRDDIVSA